MKDASSVKKFKGFGDLKDNVLAMNFIQDTVLDGSEEIAFDILKDQIEIEIVFGFDDIDEFDDVGVLDFFEDGDFPEGPLGVDIVLKGEENFFESKNLVILFAFDFPDVSVRPAADLFDDVVGLPDMGFNRILFVF